MELSKLLKQFELRIQNSQRPTKDAEGKLVALEKRSSPEELTSYLEFAQESLCELFKLHRVPNNPPGDLVLHSATMQWLMSQALVEAGREWVVEDHGVAMAPPALSKHLLDQYQLEQETFSSKLSPILSYKLD